MQRACASAKLASTDLQREKYCVAKTAVHYIFIFMANGRGVDVPGVDEIHVCTVQRDY